VSEQYSWLITRMWGKVDLATIPPEFEFHFSSAHHHARFDGIPKSGTQTW